MMSFPTKQTLELAAMDIDLSVLRSLESEKDISFETVIKAIEDALLMAYHKTEGASPAARVEVDRKTGHVTVWAREAGSLEGATAAIRVRQMQHSHAARPCALHSWNMRRVHTCQLMSRAPSRCGRTSRRSIPGSNTPCWRR